MELFSELYGCYYAVVAKIVKAAHEKGVTRADINAIVEQEAFAESGLHLIPRLLNGEWSLMRETGGLWRSRLAHAETGKPLTLLQKSWLKALLQDNRIRLFLEEDQTKNLARRLEGVEPLFRQADFHVFDRALDGDNYEDEDYIRHFRRILAAIKTKTPLAVDYRRGRGGQIRTNIIPMRLQYSEKDDKFRVMAGQLHGKGQVTPLVLNMGRVVAVHSSRREVPPGFRIEAAAPRRAGAMREVTLHITQERNALERCMMQFAFYDKETQSREDGGYLCRIRYDVSDETELLIRILSFGPVVQVLEPSSFVEQMRARVKSQLWCMEKLER